MYTDTQHTSILYVSIKMEGEYQWIKRSPFEWREFFLKFHNFNFKIINFMKNNSVGIVMA